MTEITETLDLIKQFITIVNVLNYEVKLNQY